jgi:hypothetical protein
MSESRAAYNKNGHPAPNSMTLLEAAEAQHEIIYALIRLLAEVGVTVSDLLPMALPEILRAKAAIDAAQGEAE